MTSPPDWDIYYPASIKRPADTPRQADCGELSRSRFFICADKPTAFDRNLAVSVFVILFGMTPILFVFAILKLFQ